MCIGAVACMLGDVSSGSQLIATELIDLAAIGADLRSQSAKRVRQTAHEKVLKALKDEPAFASVSHDRILDLLTRKTVSFKRSDLIEASKAATDLDLDRVLAKRLYDALPFDGDDEATKTLSLLVLEAGMRACNADNGFQEYVKSTQLVHLVQGVHQLTRKHTEIKQDLTEIRVQLSGRHLANEKLLVEQLQDKADTLRITKQLFISLARRIVKDVADIHQAHRELERVVEIASDKQAKNALPFNTDVAITAILTRADTLNNAGQIDEAAAHLLEEEANAECGLIRLYNKGIAQAILTRSAKAACNYELKKLSIETPEQGAQYGALRKILIAWYERGRDQGMNFDLEVAVALARECYLLASDSDQRGAAKNNLGTMLRSLGERESSSERLEESEVAYRAALEEYTRDRAPLGWAMTQNNLGNTLLNLGQRESGNERSDDAIVSYRAALEEYTRDRAPLDWAMTQNNLGFALWTLGEREHGTERLEEAVVAYHSALEERTRSRLPLDWALTQNNLGNALLTLGERENGTERLEEAVVAYQAALEEYTRERLPLRWALTQNNLGLALLALGERENGTERLEEAIVTCRAALDEYTRDRVPLGWALTQNNLGLALLALGARDNSIKRLEESVIACRAALEERTRDRIPLGWASTHENLALAMQAIAAQPTTHNSHLHLEAALEHVEAALEVFDVSKTPFNHGTATRLRNDLLDRLASDV